MEIKLTTVELKNKSSLLTINNVTENNTLTTTEQILINTKIPTTMIHSCTSEKN